MPNHIQNQNQILISQFYMYRIITHLTTTIKKQILREILHQTSRYPVDHLT